MKLHQETALLWVVIGLTIGAAATPWVARIVLTLVGIRILASPTLVWNWVNPYRPLMRVLACILVMYGAVLDQVYYLGSLAALFSILVCVVATAYTMATVLFGIGTAPIRATRAFLEGE